MALPHRSDKDVVDPQPIGVCSGIRVLSRKMRARSAHVSGSDQSSTDKIATRFLFGRGRRVALEKGTVSRIGSSGRLLAARDTLWAHCSTCLLQNADLSGILPLIVLPVS